MYNSDRLIPGCKITVYHPVAVGIRLEKIVLDSVLVRQGIALFLQQRAIHSILFSGSTGNIIACIPVGAVINTRLISCVIKGKHTVIRHGWFSRGAWRHGRLGRICLGGYRTIGYRCGGSYRFCNRRICCTLCLRGLRWYSAFTAAGSQGQDANKYPGRHRYPYLRHRVSFFSFQIRIKQNGRAVHLSKPSSPTSPHQAQGNPPAFPAL